MPSFNNSTVLNSLPASQPGKVWAYLIEENRTPTQPTPDKSAGKSIDEGVGKSAGKLSKQSTKTIATAPPSNTALPSGEPVFTFLANPEKLDWSRKANYSPSGAALTSVQSLQYYNTEGRSLSIKDLLLETWYQRRSIRPLLEQLQALLVPDPKNQQLHPKVLSFVWGGSRFGPCVLTDISWQETAWLNGEPASARLDMTLIEIPPTDDDPVTRIYREQPLEEAEEGALSAPLTDRQREEASTEAKKWLTDNAGKLPQSLQERVRSSRFKLASDAETGIVTLFDDKGAELGKVGRWDGREFTTDTVQDFGTQK